MTVMPMVSVVSMMAVVAVMTVLVRSVGWLAIWRWGAAIALRGRRCISAVVATTTEPQETAAAVVIVVGLVVLALELVLDDVRGNSASDATQDLAHGGMAAQLAAQERTAGATSYCGQEAPLAVGSNLVLRVLLVVAVLACICGLLDALGRSWAVNRRSGGICRLCVV